MITVNIHYEVDDGEVDIVPMVVTRTAVISYENTMHVLGILDNSNVVKLKVVKDDIAGYVYHGGEVMTVYTPVVSRSELISAIKNVNASNNLNKQPTHIDNNGLYCMGLGGVSHEVLRLFKIIDTIGINNKPYYIVVTKTGVYKHLNGAIINDSYLYIKSYEDSELLNMLSSDSINKVVELDVDNEHTQGELLAN